MSKKINDNSTKKGYLRQKEHFALNEVLIDPTGVMMFFSLRPASICGFPLLKYRSEMQRSSFGTRSFEAAQAAAATRKYTIKRSQTAAIRTLKCLFHFFVNQGEKCLYKNEGDHQQHHSAGISLIKFAICGWLMAKKTPVLRKYRNEFFY